MESFFTDADLTGAGSFDDGTGLVLGTTYLFGVPGVISHTRWRVRSPAPTGTHVGGLYQPTANDPPEGSGAGTLLGQADFPALTADTWAEAELIPDGEITPDPIPVTVGTPYRPAVFTPPGEYRALGSFFDVTGGIVRGNIKAHEDGAVVAGLDLRNGVFQVNGSLTYPKDSNNSATYYVDIVFIPDWYRIAPFRVPELTSDAGLYSFGLDFEVDQNTTVEGVFWYQPSGGAVEDVDVTLYDTATETVLASGSALAASLTTDAWNFIPFSSSYVAVPATTYTAAAQTDGRHGYDSSVTLPQVDPSGHLTMTHTRYASGGGYPTTVWDSGWHGIDIRYLFSTATTGTLDATAPAAEAALAGTAAADGVLTATAPAAVAALAGTSTADGVLTATAPAAAAALAGTAAADGVLTATAPAAVAALTGTAAADGVLTATAPAAVAALAGTSTAGGVLTATAPAAVAALAGTADVAGVLTATAPAAVAALTGIVDITGVLTVTAPAAVADLNGTSEVQTLPVLGGSVTVLGLGGSVTVLGLGGTVEII